MKSGGRLVYNGSMKVKIVFDFNEYERKIIADRWGKEIASHLELKVWLMGVVAGELETYAYDYDKNKENEGN